MQPIILLDTSYIIFYRYHALLSWYKRAYPDKELNIEIIEEKFGKLFIKCINDLVKKYKSNIKNVIFCQDSERASLWRTKIYQDYKKNRKCDIEIGKFFKMTFNTLIPQLINNGAILVSVPEAEADDIAAILTNYLLETTNENIIIITNDNDYLQLINDNVQIFNLPGNDLRKRIIYDPETDLKIKIILGDKSDNILPVFKKCNKKQAFEFVQNSKLLNKELESSNQLVNNYKLNNLLINFNQIPNNIKENIIIQFKNK